MSRAAAIFPALIFAMVAALVAAGFFVFDYSWGVIAFPFGAGAITCALCVVELVKIYSSPAAAAATAASEPEFEPLSKASLIWTFVLGLFLFALGFVFGPAAYLLVYLRVSGSSWLLAVSISAASIVVTWGIFIKLMRILLPFEPLWWS